MKSRQQLSLFQISKSREKLSSALNQKLKEFP